MSPKLKPNVPDRAVAFSTRSNSYSVLAALRVWRGAYTTHENARAFALQYHSTHLQFKLLLVWRIRLRAKLKLAKRARMVEKALITRKTWTRWRDILKEHRRERTLRELER